MPSVLFVCTANRFRSPLAAAFFNQKLQEVNKDHNWKVESAGTWCIENLPPVLEAVDEAKKRNIDIYSHRSRMINEEILSAFNLALVMEMGQKEALRSEFPLFEEKIYLLTEVGGAVPYSIPDPFTTAESPVKIAAEIEAQINRSFDLIFRALSRMKGV